MSAVGSPFCEHKKLRTGCALCKPAALPVDTTLRATPFVSEDEREKASTTRVAKATKEAKEAREEAPKRDRPTGPGKPLMPTRAKKRGVSAAEADAAKPWWIKK